MELTKCETTRPALPAPEPATILRHCRCIDCQHWSNEQGRCCVSGIRRYVPSEDYHPAMRRFRTEAGMIRPDAWHYCADYKGPQVSKDIWIWKYQKGEAS